MVNFSLEQICATMGQQSQIRNIAVIAHVDHGKTTLTDALISKGGIINDLMTGKKQYMQRRNDEQNRSITIKSSAVSLYFEVNNFDYADADADADENKSMIESYLINLIDCPGHVDFSSEVTAALRISDGALVVVDCIEGVCVQTETVLRQSIDERIKPILFLNKMDRVFNELNNSNEEIYRTLLNTIESVNVIISTYTDEAMGDLQVSTHDGSVGFGCGLQGWGFTLRDFALLYTSKFGLSTEKLMKKFWGNNYWDNDLKKWVKKQNDDENLTRGFCQFVLQPIRTLFDALMTDNEIVYLPIIRLLKLNVSSKVLSDADICGKKLCAIVMRKWIHAGDALIDMIRRHLPSPLESQQYRVEKLYSGPQDSMEANSIRNCDRNGPLSMYISKMIPTSNDDGRFIAFGRVFSGILSQGDEVRVYGANYIFGGSKDLSVTKVKRLILMMGRSDENITECPAGNLCGVLGLDDHLYKSGTLTTSSEMHPFVTMKFSVSAVVQIAVEAVKSSDLPKLVHGLKQLAQSDPLVKISRSKTGEHIIGGAGELHIEVCLKDLREMFMKNSPIVVSDPIVSFCETIISQSGDNDNNYPQICVSKSPNKLNRVYMSSQPLTLPFVDAIESKTVKLPKFNDMKMFGRLLSDKYEWDLNDAKRIWTFGCPPDSICNVLVDNTRGVQYLNEVKDFIKSSFMEVTQSGVLCNESLRGVRYNLEDAKIHSDSKHRGVGSLIPCCRRAFYACEISSCIRLLEPVYSVDISVSSQYVSDVYNTLNMRRGVVTCINEREGTPLVQMKATLPVLESFGFNGDLRGNTSGDAFAQMKFSHWDRVFGDPFCVGSNAHDIVMKIRSRKGLKPQLPNFNDYHDKIN